MPGGGVVGEFTEQRVPLVGLTRPGSTRRDAGVSFVDDDQFGALQCEFVAAAALFDEVGGDDQVRVVLVDGRTPRHLESVHRRGQQQLGVDPELAAQFRLPLGGELRGAENHEALCVAGREKFRGDQSGFDGLADTDTVCDEQSGRVLCGGHHQRHELVVAGGVTAS